MAKKEVNDTIDNEMLIRYINEKIRFNVESELEKQRKISRGNLIIFIRWFLISMVTLGIFLSLARYKIDIIDSIMLLISLVGFCYFIYIFSKIAELEYGY